MPSSQQPQEGQQMVVDQILENPQCIVLDMGAGAGRWGKLLKGKVQRIDGIEIHEPTAIKYNIAGYYDNIYIQDICKFKRLCDYDVIVIGDVLEHLSYENALILVDRLKNETSAIIYLIIPITKCIQDGKVYGNPYETHLYQWSDTELTALGWRQIHSGLNQIGKVKIGTYIYDTIHKQ